MEMRNRPSTYNHRLITSFLAACLFMALSAGQICAQNRNSNAEASYTIRNGRMYITIGKNMKKEDLEKFIDKYDLSDLNLPRILSTNAPDRLRKMGWRIDMDNRLRIIISKQMLGLGQLADPEKRIELAEEEHPNSYDLFPAQNDNLVYGVNHFTGKYPFAVQDSLVTFFLKGHTMAHEVLLAGSFTNWQYSALPMTPTDSGWICIVKLGPGKYWYKFIVNRGWTTDPDNDLSEPDPRGNVNSVYYKPNTIFTLPGHREARDAYLTGSFNNWNPGELPMEKGPFGWTIRLYLAEGAYPYKFVADGKWYEDPTNKNHEPDGHKGFNSVYRLGQPHLFTLKGYLSAKSVALSGSFNNWQTYDLLMDKTAQGWQLRYTLGPGNYKYRFMVDGKWITDPGNSSIIIQPNYTFQLKGFADAKTVCLAGDFNDWTPDALRMKQVGGVWTFSVHLSVGKHLYKFIVDGRWIKDPANPLWEENQYNTDNSVLWMEGK